MSGPGGAARIAARRIRVGGRVQGVGFRWSAMAAAERTGVVGWVRNLADGRVEVHAQGEPSAVEALVGWLGQGPIGAEVTSLQQEAVPVQPDLESFVIRR